MVPGAPDLLSRSWGEVEVEEETATKTVGTSEGNNQKGIRRSQILKGMGHSPKPRRLGDASEMRSG